MRIDKLTGDATVKDVRFENGTVSFRYEDNDLDEDYEITFSTDRLYSESSGEVDSVHIRIKTTQNFLEVEPKSGCYVAPSDFGKQMQMVREGYQLALGLKASEYPLLFQVRGYRILIACPITSIEAVKVNPMK